MIQIFIFAVQIQKNCLLNLPSVWTDCFPSNCAAFSLYETLSGAYLLHVSQHILPGVEHSFPFFGVELVDEVCRVVLVTVLISMRRHRERKQMSGFTYATLSATGPALLRYWILFPRFHLT